MELVELYNEEWQLRSRNVIYVICNRVDRADRADKVTTFLGVWMYI